MGVATLRFKLMPRHSSQVVREWHSDVMSHSVSGVPFVCENAENHPDKPLAGQGRSIMRYNDAQNKLDSKKDRMRS
jgi:hypothetical protein